MTFKANQSSSLWDANYQCKPAFFAVVKTAEKYRELTALIDSTEKADPSGYSDAKKQSVASALKSAKAAMKRNYSATDSAADSLAAAAQLLKTATAP